MQGAYFSTHYSPESKDPRMVKFVAAFKQRYNAMPNALAAWPMTPRSMLFAAIKRAGQYRPAKIRDAIAATKDFPGVTGNITIDKRPQRRQARSSCCKCGADAMRISARLSRRAVVRDAVGSQQEAVRRACVISSGAQGSFSDRCVQSRNLLSWSSVTPNKKISHCTALARASLMRSARASLSCVPLEMTQARRTASC